MNIYLTLTYYPRNFLASSTSPCPSPKSPKPPTQDLNISRCAITDLGAVKIFQALAEGSLASLDVSWNSLRGDSARALRETLATNGSLQYINLSYNGLSDMDASRVLMGLTNHGEAAGAVV